MTGVRGGGGITKNKHAKCVSEGWDQWTTVKALTAVNLTLDLVGVERACVYGIDPTAQAASDTGS